MSINFILFNTVGVSCFFFFKDHVICFVKSCGSARQSVSNNTCCYLCIVKIERSLHLFLLHPVEVPGKLFQTTLVVVCV